MLNLNNETLPENSPTTNGSGKISGVALFRILVAVFAVFLVVYWIGDSGVLHSSSSGRMQEIKNQVADDAVRKYHIARDTGSATDRCVYAGMVYAAYVQADNEEEAQTWKAVEEGDCRAAGVPQ